MKSQVKYLVGIAICILNDAAAKCTAVTVNQRDIDTLISRVEHEGLSFLTLTLATYVSDFEHCLAVGRIETHCFKSFKKQGAIPAFLSGMLSHVFDKRTGRILNEADIDCIASIRQFCHAYRKINASCTQPRIDAAFEGFIQIEKDLQGFEPDPSDVNDFVIVARMLYGVDLCRISTEDLIPKHGPGATAEHFSGNRKWSGWYWHERLEPYFPYFPNCKQYNAYDSKEFQDIPPFISEDAEPPVRVICVPKTLKAPRIIAIEPVCMQYAQQALSKVLVKTLEHGKYTAGHINFSDQSVNRALALSSSRTGRKATIDLSAASEWVLHSLAMRMFEIVPDLQGAIDACRTRTASTPLGVIPLKKFASMGSALCFPIEAMYFYTCCVIALLREYDLPVTSSSLKRVCKEVYVYGDDIIVPTDAAETVMKTLTAFGLRVNTAKSFWTGMFRESCGMDAYGGEEVTPTYIRQMPPCGRQDEAELISWVATSNQFFKKGYWRTAAHIQQRCERYLGVLPVVSEESAALGVVSFSGVPPLKYKVGKYQEPVVKAWVPQPVYQRDPLDGYSALQKCLLSMECRSENNWAYDEMSPINNWMVSQAMKVAPITEKEHLCRTARHGAVTLKRRWSSPH